MDQCHLSRGPRGQSVEKIFNQLVEELRENLPDFGKILAIDGKAFASYTCGQKQKKEKPALGL